MAIKRIILLPSVQVKWDLMIYIVLLFYKYYVNLFK